MKPRESLGSILHYWRWRHAMTQERAASLAGINPQILGWWETDNRRPSVEQIAALSEALDATDFEFDAAVAALREVKS